MWRFYFSFSEFFCSFVPTINKSMILHYINVIFFCLNSTCTSSHPSVFCKKAFPRNFAKFTEKHLYLRPVTLLKKRLWHRCSPVDLAKFLRTPFLPEHLRFYTCLSPIPASFFIFLQVVRKLFKFTNNGLQTNESLANEANSPSFLLLFVYSFLAIAGESVQTVSV